MVNWKKKRRKNTRLKKRKNYLNSNKKKIKKLKEEIKKSELNISILDIDLDESSKVKKDENNISKTDVIKTKYNKLNEFQIQIFMNFYNKISSDEEEDKKDSYDSNENLNARNKENIFENILYNPNNNTTQTESIKKETKLEKNFLDKK
jgi:hypothetical protein